MFVDEARIFVAGGKGGDGLVSFRREKFVPRGGPWGGDGGRGGSVIAVADQGLGTLQDFRHQRHFRAESGEPGGKNNRHGKDGADLTICVPPGTVIRDAETQAVLADLTEPGQSVVLAAGGRGGRGNARFATSINRAPRMAEKGEPGEARWLVLELRLLADVGLVGFPNAGKSTLLARVSRAQPRIADYPFSTLAPMLGVVTSPDGQRSFVLADIPGLIEGAHQGAGLGLQFLRHIERTRVLLHLVDASSPDPAQDIAVVEREMAAYRMALLERPRLIALNKIDLPEVRDRVPELTGSLEASGYRVRAISAATGEGVDELLWAVLAELDRARSAAPNEGRAPAERLAELDGGAAEPAGAHTHAVFRVRPDEEVEIRPEGSEWVVSGRAVLRRVAMTDFANEEALLRWHRYTLRSGLIARLKRAGVSEEQRVRVGERSFRWRDGRLEPA